MCIAAVLWEDFSHLDSPSDVQCILLHIQDSCLLAWFICLSHFQFGLFGMVRLSLGGLGHHQVGTGLGRLFPAQFGHGQFLCVAIVSVILSWYHQRRGLAYPAAGPFW